jgi:hypothetical protein
MKKVNTCIQLLFVILLAVLTSGCLFKVPYSETADLKIDKRLLGTWEGPTCKATIKEVNDNRYSVNFTQASNFVGSKMIFRIIADGYLTKKNGYYIGQFKVSELLSGKSLDKLRPDKELNGYFVIGIIEDIKENSFVFDLIHPELLQDYYSKSYKDQSMFFGKQPNLTTNHFKNYLDRFIENGNFRKKQYSFTRSNNIDS